MSALWHRAAFEKAERARWLLKHSSGGFKNKAVFHSPTVRTQPRALSLSEPAITTHGRAAAVMSQAISRAPAAAISPVVASVCSPFL